VTLSTIVRQIASDYRKLPDLLHPGTTGPVDVTGIRQPAPVHSPVPINVEVSDLIRSIERATLAWEWELTRAFWLPAPYWTKPVRQAVPLSLIWSAGIIDNPPEEKRDGYWQATTVPDNVAAWMLEGATELHAQCLRLVAPPVRAVRVEEPCPRCRKHTLMGRAGTDSVRCVTTGCGFAHTPLVAAV
jgi:hypothetical protein